MEPPLLLALDLQLFAIEDPFLAIPSVVIDQCRLNIRRQAAYLVRVSQLSKIVPVRAQTVQNGASSVLSQPTIAII